MPDLITAASDATPAWFTAVLRDQGYDAEVTGVTFAPVGTGQMAENARFVLAYDRPTDAPATLVGKFPARDEASRAAGAHGGYAKEVSFYQSVASTVSVRTPRCYLALLGDDDIDFTLLLEDLAPAVQGDQIAGCTPDQARAAVINVAGLHGPRWNDTTLAEIDGLALPGDAESIAFVQMLMSEMTPGFIDRYRTHLSDSDAEILTRFAAGVTKWLERDLPGFGLVHGDYRLDNLLFAAAGTAPPVSAVDWQTLSIGAPVNDVSYMLGTGLDPSDRAAHESQIVADYHTALLDASGGRVDAITMTADACFAEYRWGSLHGPLIIVLGSMLVVQTGRGDDMFMAMLSRSLRQIRDLEALDLLA